MEACSGRADDWEDKKVLLVPPNINLQEFSPVAVFSML